MPVNAKIEIALPFVLRNEGVFVYDPDDPGGPTKFGITLAALAEWRRRPITMNDVKNLTLTEVTKIYKVKYWDVLQLDTLTSQSMATTIFDCAVNRGIATAKQYTKETCRKLGKVSINECNSMEFIRAFELRCEQGYQNIVIQKPWLAKFITGWLNRARRLLNLI